MKKRKIYSLFVLVVLVQALVPVRSFGDTSSAVAYLKSKPANPWSIMALAVAGAAPDASSLKTVDVSSAINLEAPILAMAATGNDPRTFAGQDLIARLKGFYDGTQLGNASMINDDIFGLLALAASGVSSTDPVAAGVKNFIVSHQNTDGGWGYAVGGATDTNTTAAAVMALAASGVSSPDPAAVRALAYLKGTQNPDGGFPYDPKSSWGTASDASSDSWVIMAAAVSGQDAHAWQADGKSPFDHVQSLQATAGYFSYQVGSPEDSFSPVTTSYAVIALSGKYLPVGVFSGAAAPSSSIVHITYRIEGKTAQLCAGGTDAATALDVVKAAATSCGISYHIQSSSLGQYVDQIGGDAASGANGWMYAVNNAQPPVGAADYQLAAGDDVLWWWGDGTEKPLRLTAALAQASSGQPVAVRADEFYSGAWKPAQGAAIHAGNSVVISDANGETTLNPADGVYQVYADGSGYVRSAATQLVVGAPVQNSVNLSVTLGGGPGGSGSGANVPNGGTISFSVDTESLDFGNVAAGAAAERTVTIQNTGQVGIGVGSSVTGDTIFRDNLTVDGKSWRMFSAQLPVAASHTAAVALSIPANETGSGTKTGALIFWATPALP